MHKDIFVFGTSIDQGFYDQENGGWVSLFFGYLNRRTISTKLKDFFAVYNLSISGCGVENTLARFRAEVAARKQEDNVVTIFSLGGNDAVRNNVTGENVCPLHIFSEKYQALITQAKEIGDVVCIGIHDSDEALLDPIPHWAGHSALDSECDRYNEEIKRLAEVNSVLFIDVKGDFSDDLNLYLEDGDHPTAAGHRLIYERVKAELEKAGIL